MPFVVLLTSLRVSGELTEAAMVSLLHSHDVSWRLPEALLVH